MGDSTERTLPPALRYASQPDAQRAAVDADLVTTLLARELEHALRGVAGADILVDGDSVTVPRLRPEGPDVTATIVDGRCTLSIGCWHEDMPSREATLDYVLGAVRGDLRVRVDRLGGRVWQCALERRQSDDVWAEESVLIFPSFSLWPRQKTTNYLVNAT